MAKGSPFEVFRTFLVLGLTSFGGPIAHLGYFRREFVEKRGWMSTEEYGALLALCQFLPGPASSQTGFCIGLNRAGLLGGVAAWLGFTLPSALLMAALAHYAALFQGHPLLHGVLHGLQLAAVAVVAQAVWLMARSLCPDTPRRALALLATAILAIFPDTGGQVLVLVIGGVIGWLALDDSSLVRHRETRRLAREWPDAQRELRLHGPALLAVALFGLLLLAAFIVPASGPWALAGAFYRSGALVFGGGHVVLPLLRDAVVVPGWVSPPVFLAGYGAAQAVPGPLFTVAAFLGAVSAGYKGAAIATVAIFLPGLLIVSGALPYWQQLRTRPHIAAVMKGLNAAVVGLLGAAFINLLTLSTVRSLWDLPIAAGALLLLTAGQARPILVVAFCAAAGAAL
ncbi:chromate efflux transporter [Acidocella sp. KAb 2-4]|uniref:chromate efflux transporter n=1 Tax=Acidocella sp. KAb 2-4 TaxID=2885158 RepID=UPI001D077519|nr:chromate efflux transporter [Acidocella sp. KAb 2-4]MCB5943878.1 chromate efflux transporter [Acidocella sp. KAb 2-4]